MGTARAFCAQSPSNEVIASTSKSRLNPDDMVSKSLTVIRLSRSSRVSGSSSFVKKEITGSFTDNLPSSTANPTAVEVKVLLADQSTFGVWAFRVGA